MRGTLGGVEDFDGFCNERYSRGLPIAVMHESSVQEFVGKEVM